MDFMYEMDLKKKLWKYLHFLFHSNYLIMLASYYHYILFKFFTFQRVHTLLFYFQLPNFQINFLFRS